MNRIFIFLIPLLFFQSAFAREVLFRRSVPFDQATCNLGGFKVGLFLRHDQPPADSQAKETKGAPLVYMGSSQVHLIQMLKEPTPGDYFFLTPEENSLCDKTRVYDLGAGHVALFYLENNRPHQDIHHAIVYNYKADRVLEKINLGSVDDLFSVKNGFAYSPVPAKKDSNTIEVILPSGQKMNATEKNLGAIRVVRVSKGQVKNQYDPDLSYEKSPWKTFFKNKKEFLRTAGWDSKKKEFKNEIVYQTAPSDDKESVTQETCIALTSNRDSEIQPKDWRCKQEKQ